MPEFHEGGCACGAVRYRVHGAPIVSTVCHCKFCQKRLASAFAVLATFEQSCVEDLRGNLVECEYHSDVSGRWLKMKFCACCGTTISHTSELRPGMRSVAAGTFDEQDWFKVDRHIWVQSKRPWVSIPSDVQAFQQGYVAPTA